MDYVIKVSGLGAGQKIMTDTPELRQRAEELLNRYKANGKLKPLSQRRGGWFANDEDIPVTSEVAKLRIDEELEDVKNQRISFEREKAEFEAKVKAFNELNSTTETDLPKKEPKKSAYQMKIEAEEKETLKDSKSFKRD